MEKTQSLMKDKIYGLSIEISGGRVLWSEEGGGV